MKLHCEIISKSASPIDPSSSTVQYGCFDGQDTQQISFFETTTVAHATFLAEHVLRNDDESAYATMMRHIAETGFEAIEVGTFFTSDDDHDLSE